MLDHIGFTLFKVYSFESQLSWVLELNLHEAFSPLCDLKAVHRDFRAQRSFGQNLAPVPSYILPFSNYFSVRLFWYELMWDICVRDHTCNIPQNKSFSGLLSPSAVGPPDPSDGSSSQHQPPTKSKSSFSLASKTYAMLNSSSSKLKLSVSCLLIYFWMS